MSRFVEGQDRSQVTLIPECLDDFIAADNPVRVVDAFVQELDLSALGFKGTMPASTGRPSYDPAVLLRGIQRHQQGLKWGQSRQQCRAVGAPTRLVGQLGVEAFKRRRLQQKLAALGRQGLDDLFSQILGNIRHAPIKGL